MREIKFRGLTEGGTCVYGDLINYENGRKAIIGRQLSAPGYLSVEGARISPVKAETIGQYTGLKDVNGVEIYEGDIVQVSGNDGYYVTAKVVHECGAFWVYSESISMVFEEDCNKMVMLGSIYIHDGDGTDELDRISVVKQSSKNPELLEKNDE